MTTKKAHRELKRLPQEAIDLMLDLLRKDVTTLWVNVREQVEAAGGNAKIWTYYKARVRNEHGDYSKIQKRIPLKAINAMNAILSENPNASWVQHQEKLERFGATHGSFRYYKKKVQGKPLRGSKTADNRGSRLHSIQTINAINKVLQKDPEANWTHHKEQLIPLGATAPAFNYYKAKAQRGVSGSPYYKHKSSTNPSNNGHGRMSGTFQVIWSCEGKSVSSEMRSVFDSFLEAISRHAGGRLRCVKLSDPDELQVWKTVTAR